MKNEKNNRKDLVFEMLATNVLTKYQCGVCGGHTNKDLVICSAETGGEYNLVACRHCVKLGNPDERLKRRIEDLKKDTQRMEYTIKKSKKYIEEAKKEIDFCKTFFGRMHLPSCEEWEKAETEAIAKLGLGIME
jgi:hypothetical protein